MGPTSNPGRASPAVPCLPTRRAGEGERVCGGLRLPAAAAIRAVQETLWVVDRGSDPPPPYFPGRRFSGQIFYLTPSVPQEFFLAQRCGVRSTPPSPRWVSNPPPPRQAFPALPWWQWEAVQELPCKAGMRQRIELCSGPASAFRSPLCPDLWILAFFCATSFVEVSCCVLC